MDDLKWSNYKHIIPIDLSSEKYPKQTNRIKHIKSMKQWLKKELDGEDYEVLYYQKKVNGKFISKIEYMRMCFIAFKKEEDAAAFILRWFE